MEDIVCTHIYIHIYLHICIHMCISCVVINERDCMKLDRGRFALGFFRGAHASLALYVLLAANQFAAKQSDSQTIIQPSSQRTSQPASQAANQPFNQPASLPLMLQIASGLYVRLAVWLADWMSGCHCCRLSQPGKHDFVMNSSLRGAVCFVGTVCRASCSVASGSDSAR